MTQSGEVYKCEICGNVVNVMQPGVGELVCCGESMRLLSQEEAQAY
ncbi:MAG: desulfoferrodoxin FeS4 iron-binding domain-containing protein [Desulfobacterales bacterium]